MYPSGEIRYEGLLPLGHSHRSQEWTYKDVDSRDIVVVDNPSLDTNRTSPPQRSDPLTATLEDFIEALNPPTRSQSSKISDKSLGF